MEVFNSMAMNSTQLKGVEVDKNKEQIIEKYVSGVKIHTLAGEFNITTDTLCRRLKKWGIKLRIGDFRKKIHERKHWKRKFSKELLATRKALTEKFDNQVTYVEIKDNPQERRLISNILTRSFL